MRERRWEEDEGSGDRDLQVHPYLFQITNSVDNPAAGVVNRGCLGGQAAGAGSAGPLQSDMAP